MELRLVYATALVAGSLLSLAMGLWVARMDDAEARSAFLVYIAANVLWGLWVACGLFVAGATANELVLYGSELLAVTTVFLFTRFAFAYTGHDTAPTDGVFGVVAASYLGLVALVATDPLHSRYWIGTTYRAEPFPYTETVDGVVAPLVEAWSLLVLAVGLYYFVELFVKSRHRSSLSVVLLVAGVFGAVIPTLLTQLGLTAVEGFDHAPLGIPLFVVPASYAVFRLGMMDVPPVARDNLLDELRDPVLVLDAERTLLDYNAASEALAEPLAASDPVGRDAATLLPEVFDAIGLPDDPDATATESVTMADGATHRHYSVLVSPVAEEGTVVAYAVMLRDVTELESTRRELERTNERLDRFASVVSHDLRNPINVAEGYADSLASDIERADVRGEPTAADMLDTLGEIETSHERMRTIISDLRTLAHSRDRVEDPDPHRFGDVARDAWDTVDTADASLVVETDGRIYADRGRLRSVFENLFRNSAEHGSVSSRSEADDAADAEGLTVRVGLTEAGFYVADDGPGIPEDSRDEVFEYGYTTSSAGTGLGLSIVRSMAESHGWQVALADAATDGARFEFEDVVVRPDDGAATGQASVGESATHR